MTERNAETPDDLEAPRAIGGRAPDVFTPGGWVPMAHYNDDEEVDVAIVGTGAGGATLACKLAEAGFSVVAFEAGPFWRPLDEFASDEREQEKLFWTDERLSGGDDPITFGDNNSGRGVGGSMTHFTMVSLRFRPEWFKSRSALGYGHDWPVDWREMWRYYDEVEEALKISGPVRYPWGPPRGRYPYRPHRPNAAGEVLARGCEAAGLDWAPVPLATLSAPRGKAHPCVYRGFCKQGCSTNAKQSALTTWIPRALAAGAEIRDMAMVGRIETSKTGRASGLIYHRRGQWKRQRARHVVVAGYSVETPRLLLNSANDQFPDGLANRSGLVGRGLMTHANHAVWGTFPESIRWYKGPPVMTLSEHFNYDDSTDFHGGYAFMSQGPMPADWATTLATKRGLWGMDLRREMLRYNHQAGLKIVGEVLPHDDNRVELAEETDDFGLRRARVTFGYGDNDRALQAHALDTMNRLMQAAGGRDLWSEDGTAHLMGGCRMGFSPDDSVTNADGRTWDISNLWICDGSLFPTGGGVNPSLTIQALACRIADRMQAMAACGEM